MHIHILVGTDRGLMIMRPGHTPNEAWQTVSVAHPTEKIQAVAVSSDNCLWAASQSGHLYKSRDEINWVSTDIGGETPNIKCIDVGYRPESEQQATIFLGTMPPSVYRSKDSGMHWSKLPGFDCVPGSANWTFPLPPYQATVRKIARHPHYSNLVMAGIAQGGFLSSLDGGLTWTERPVSPGSEVNDLAIHPGCSTRVLAATSTGIYRSLNLGDTWKAINKGLPYHFARCLSVSPHNYMNVMIGVSQLRRTDSPNILAFSGDGGDNWEVRTTGLPSLNGYLITCMTSLHNNMFAFGTDTGNMFITSDCGKMWRSFYLNNVPVRCMVLYEV